MALDTVINIYIAALVLVSIGGVIADWRFIRYLKTNHPATWERLGKPMEYFPVSPRQLVEVQPFIWRRRYAELNDPIATERGDTVLYTQLLVIVGLVGLFPFVTLLNRLATGI